MIYFNKLKNIFSALQKFQTHRRIRRIPHHRTRKGTATHPHLGQKDPTDITRLLRSRIINIDCNIFAIDKIHSQLQCGRQCARMENFRKDGRKHRDQ